MNDLFDRCDSSGTVQLDKLRAENAALEQRAELAEQAHVAAAEERDHLRALVLGEHALAKDAVPKDVVYVLEWGAISLPLGHPSRITCMEVHYTAAEAAAEAEACDFDCRVFPITIPDPSGEPR